MSSASKSLPEGVGSILDNDLYKLTMQSAVLKFFPDVEVTYAFTNRTYDMKLNRAAYSWLQIQIERMGDIQVTNEELEFLRQNCTYLSPTYLAYLKSFSLRPKEHVHCNFLLDRDTGNDQDLGDLDIRISGLWVETILYEILLLELVSEAYFKFRDTDWSYEDQQAKAKRKGLAMLEHGCIVSEFGCRRRRDYHTQELVLLGLKEAQEEGEAKGYRGKISGTSNVHFAMKLGLTPIGTVAHEWFMGVAAVIGSYPDATETALKYWIETFGKGVLSIALTDTFGTSHFLQAFKKPIPPSFQKDNASQTLDTYADVFTGTRQDSGDPSEFIKIMRNFYDRENITSKKTIVFSDSLNVDKCIEYQNAAERAGFQPSFGVGTFLTNDYERASDGRKSVPMNIVIKLSSADGKPAIKISDNIGKNTGDEATVDHVKKQLGYVEHEWEEGDERTRWGVGGTKA